MICRIYRDDITREAVNAFRVNIIHARQQVGDFMHPLQRDFKYSFEPFKATISRLSPFILFPSGAFPRGADRTHLILVQKIRRSVDCRRHTKGLERSRDIRGPAEAGNYDARVFREDFGGWSSNLSFFLRIIL